MTPDPVVDAITVPLQGHKLTPAKWRKIEQHLEDWKQEVLAAARKHPARSFRLGHAQVSAFADLLANVNAAIPELANFGGTSPSMREAEAWSRSYTLHELTDALNVYIGKIKDALLYGLRGAINPTEIAALLYRATQDATVNWRMIARTEMARANAEGRLAAIEAMGYEQVWCPPHMGSCKWCKGVLENRVFNLKDVQGRTNFGRKPGDYVACCPLHPNCRHGWLPYEPEVYELMQEQYRALEAAGLDEATLDDLFDSSGQVKAEHADDPRLAALKTLDVHAELLALAVYKVRCGARGEPVGKRAVEPAWFGLDELRTDVYQRAVDPEKVFAMLQQLRAGRDLPQPKVNIRDDGTVFVTDGQHRVEAHRLFGSPFVFCDVDVGQSFTQEAEDCRAAIAKIHDPTNVALAAVLESDAAVSLSYASSLAVAKLDDAVPLLAGPGRPVTLDEARAAAPDGCWRCASPEHYAEACPRTDPLDELPHQRPISVQPAAVFDGARLRDDVALALEQWWQHVAGEDWQLWSQLYVRYDGRAIVLVDYDHLRDTRKAWRQLAEVDLHFALVAATLGAVRAREIAPGIALEPILHGAGHPDDLGVVPWPEVTWSLATASWVNGEPALDEQADLEKTWPDYTFVQADLEKSEQLPLEERLLTEDAFLAKMAPTKEAANVGVEHWITIHPHGDDEKGQPVLVRNNADGTMTVIGGAGGNLNMMRLDPSRRVDRDGEGKSKGAKGAGQVEQHVSEAESEQASQQREREISEAREALAKVKEQRDTQEADLRAYLKENLGIDLEDGALSHAQRRKLMARIRTSAMRTLAYGPVSRRDTAEGADAQDLGLDKDDAPKAWPNASDDSDKKSESEDGGVSTPRPSVAMGEDHAREVLDRLLDLGQLSKIGGQHRRVIAGEAKASNALQIDWSQGTDTEARDERRAKAVEQQIRTDLNRTLLEHGDQQWKRYDRRYEQSFQQGGFDSIDAFCHSILGETVLSREAFNLLGVAGAAQLVGHAIQTKAGELGKQGLDLDKVQAALKDLTDEQERGVNERGVQRMQRALARSAQAYAELSKSERGESLFTTTMARSIATEKLMEAKRGLGMMIGGLEATSALKTALDRRADEKVKVGGFSSPAQIKDLAAKARVKVREGDITRVGAGNYTLSVEPERLAGLVRPEGKGDVALRKRLEQIRTGKDLDAEIKAAQTGPGMVHELDANQARGKMYLLAAGSGVLGFDPGVGKTHTAIAAAMEKMAAEPGKHRALIVAPTNMLRSWRDTIAAQSPQFSVDIHDGSDRALHQVVGQSDTNPDKDTTVASKRREQLTRDAHFTIVSYESLRSYQNELKDRGDQTHSIVIADELQKAKNEDAGLHRGVEKAVDLAREAHGDDACFWGLTGTPIEKDVGDIHAMQKLVARAKGRDHADKKTYRGKFGKLGQDEHIARGDKVREFRKSLDEDLFRLSAKDAGNDLPEPAREHHPVELTDDHKAAIQERVNKINAQIADYHRRKEAGELRVDADGKTEKPIAFGGRDALMDALYNHENSSLARSVADNIAGMNDTFTHDGKEYEHKHVVFGAKETSQALFGKDWNKGGGPGGLHAELEKRGIKVFTGNGHIASSQNEANYKAFLAHEGKAVFLTNDKNNAGISLQFGENKGAFQHGATHMHHFTRPVNNATIQQREGRILRKGAQSGVKYHTYSADTPIEQRLEETLERELRTQDLAANSEQQVAGSDTLAHHLQARGATALEFQS